MKSSRRGKVDPFIVMDVMEAARKAEADGRHIIHMEVGQPGTAAPNAARDALKAELDQDALGYTVALGLPALRERISKLYDDWYGLEVDPARIIVTSGSSGAFLLAFTNLFDAGAKIGVPEPGYPSYRQILRALDLIPVGLQTDNATRHQPVIPDGLDGVMIASPANPTGTMLDRTSLAKLVSDANAKGTTFISDEIYHGLHHGERAVSALEISDDLYVINSFSKYFSMTGWRLGWMVVPKDHVRDIERLQQNMFICAPHAAQVAGLAALDATDETENFRAVYAENRRLMIEGLAAAGVTEIAPPDGAFYIYADVSIWTDDSLKFASEILGKADVAVTPGLDFDPERGHQFLRFSYARQTEDIVEGIERLQDFFAETPRKNL